MPNLMDSSQYVYGGTVQNAPSQNIEELVNQIRQNPSAFEDYVRNTNPQAYQMALQLRNSPNPQAMVMQMAQAKGLNPNILRMFGLR